ISISSSPTSRPRGAVCSNAGSRSARSGTRHPWGPGKEATHPASTPRAETMPALPASPIRMATAGCYRNGATRKRDGVGLTRRFNELFSIHREARYEYAFSARPWDNGIRKGQLVFGMDALLGRGVVTTRSFLDWYRAPVCAVTQSTDSIQSLRL